MTTISETSRELRPLAEYTKRIPSSRAGKRLNRATLWRWTLRGVRGRVLRTVEIGGSRYTCDAWVAEFSRETRPTATGTELRDPGTRAEVDEVGARLRARRSERRT